MKTQRTHFYESHCRAAAALHERMAARQEEAGRPDLARASRETAHARRIAAEDIAQGTDVRLALEHAEWRKDQPV